MSTNSLAVLFIGIVMNLTNYMCTSRISLVVENKLLLFRIARTGIFPRSSLLGAGQLGFWEFGKGGTVRGRVGQIGSVYKQPETEVDDSCHSWRVPSKWKGTQRGSKGELARGARGIAPCIYVTVTVLCVQRMIEPLE